MHWKRFEVLHQKRGQKFFVVVGWFLVLFWGDLGFVGFQGFFGFLVFSFHHFMFARSTIS